MLLGLVCTCLSSAQATVYYCRAYVLLFRLTSHLLHGACVLALAHWPSLSLCCRAYVLFWLPRPTLCTEVCMQWRGLYATPFLATWACPLHPCGLCALSGEACMLCHSQLPRPVPCTARVVCTAEVSEVLPLSRQSNLAHLLCWVTLGFSQFPKSAVWSGLQSEHLSWAENCSFLCFLPLSPCFAQFSEIPPLTLGPACEGASQCMGTLPVSGLPPSWDTCSLSRSSLSFPFLCLHPLLPLLQELSLPSWRPGVFCCHPEAALYLDEFF